MRVRFETDFQGKARAASEAAAKAVFQILNARFQAALRAPVYSWPGETVRSNGQVAGTTRNIVDTANLFRSNTGPEIDGLRVRYAWRTPYATAAHEGAQLQNGTVLPGRRWTSAVLGTEPVDGIEPYDYRKAFRGVWLARFKGR
jgi:hypothetical protein